MTPYGRDRTSLFVIQAPSQEELDNIPTLPPQPRVHAVQTSLSEDLPKVFSILHTTVSVSRIFSPPGLKKRFVTPPHEPLTPVIRTASPAHCPHALLISDAAHGGEYEVGYYREFARLQVHGVR
jgi:hypothetical protein